MNLDLKLVLVGDKDVGKTSVFNRYVYEEVSKTQITIGAYFALKTCHIVDKFYKVAIWDTAGEEKFDALTKFYTRGAKCALIVFDLTSRRSFRAVKKWADHIEKEDCVILILGNKHDLVDSRKQERQAKDEEIKNCATQINALYCEGSALTGYGISEAFQSVLTEYVKLYGDELKKKEEFIDLDEVDFIKKKKCC